MFAYFLDAATNVSVAHLHDNVSYCFICNEASVRIRICNAKKQGIIIAD